MKKAFRFVKRNGVLVSVATASMAVSSVTFAAMPAGATSALQGIQDTGTSMIDAAWPVAGAIIAGLIGIKLFKKVANKAT